MPRGLNTYSITETVEVIQCELRLLLESQKVGYNSVSESKAFAKPEMLDRASYICSTDQFSKKVFI